MKTKEPFWQRKNCKVMDLGLYQFCWRYQQVYSFFLQAPFEQYAVEFFGWLGCEVYIIMCSLSMGINTNDIARKNTKSILVSALLCGATFLLLFVILTGDDSINIVLPLFVCVVVLNFIFNIFIKYASRKKQKELDDTMNEDEMND